MKSKFINSKLSKQLFIVCEIFNEKLIPILSLVTCISPTIKARSLKQIILYIIPMNIIYTFCAYVAYSMALYQMIYFYLICYYLRIKTRECNNRIRNYIKNRIALNDNRTKNLMNSIIGQNIYSGFGYYSLLK
jgi:hypothetical protein